MSDPLVSTIIPTYNRSASISNSIISVLRQNYRNIELIVVDDGSNDNTEDVVSKINDSRLRYCKLSGHYGANYARNYGIDISNGEYIAFQDSDDVWHTDKLLKQLDFLTLTDSDAVFCPILQHDKGKLAIYPYLDRKEDLLRHVLTENVISTQTLLGKKSIFIEEKFNNGLGRFQDWELAIRLISRYKVNFQREPLTDVYISEDSISKSHEKAVLALEYILNAHSELIEKYNTKYILENKALGFAIKAGMYKEASQYIDDLYKNNRNVKICIYKALQKLHLLTLINLKNIL